jgi:hypothetical protein
MAWKNFSKVLAGITAEPISNTSQKAKQILINPKRANKGTLYLGGATVSSDNGLEIIPPAVATTPMIPLHLTGDYGNGMDLSSLYIIGGATDGIQGAYEEF